MYSLHKKTTISALVFSLVLLSPAMAAAQRCDTVYETIMTLRPPLFGFPTVWDATYEVGDKMTQLASSVPLENGNVLSVGRTLSREDFKPESIFLVELNRRGRAMNEYRFKAKDGERPVKMLGLEKSYVVLSDIASGQERRTGRPRLSWYGEDGSFIRERVIEDNNYFYESENLAHAVDGSGFVVVLHAESKTDAQDQHGVLVRYSADGRQMWKRAYRVGVSNRLTSLTKVDSSSYLTTGRIKGEGGYMDGWVMKVGFDGAVLWQRTYPRGRFALLNDAAVMINKLDRSKDLFILSGNALPIDGTPQAAWLMGVDALGEVKWQRFYRLEDYEMTKNWLSLPGDGRIEMIQNATSLPDSGEDVRSHIRMFTLSPRAVLMSDEAYIEGLQARATDYIKGWNGERIVTAFTESDETLSDEEKKEVLVLGISKPLDETEENPEQKDRLYLQPPPEQEDPLEDMAEARGPVHKGWVIVGTALEPYEDPCQALFRR